MSANYGRAFVYGDGINTDMLAPGIYMKHPIATIATHCLESVDKDFAGAVKPGDVVVAGQGFGIGSSREQAAEALKHLGVAAVLARSYGGIFYRNALNFGLPVLVCSDVEKIGIGDLVSAGISCLIIMEARRMGAPNHLVARMIGNVAIDGLAGSVPIIGDLIDVAFRANLRNMRLLRRHFEQIDRA